MPRSIILVAVALLVLSVSVLVPQMATAQPKRDRTYVVSTQTLKAIEEAAPHAPAAEPRKARKVLVYGRVPTHPESVACCFKAMEIMGRKTGAFEAVSSGDPAMFLPEKLGQFDVVVMNNTHEQDPMLPWDFEQLGPEEQAAFRDVQQRLPHVDGGHNMSVLIVTGKVTGLYEQEATEKIEHRSLRFLCITNP